MLKKIIEDSRFIFAIAILIAFAVAWENIGPVISNDNVVQDDFRQSCFWLWQYWDPELFKNSFYTVMYKSLMIRTPLLHLIYMSAPLLTENLLFFSKAFALIISIASSIFAYLYFNNLTKNRLLSLAFTLAMTTVFWCTDHISSAHTRAFTFIGIFAHMYYKGIGKDLWAAITSFILIFISPITFLICMAMEFFHLLIKYLPQIKSINFKAKETMQDLGLFVFNNLTVAFMYLVLFKDISTMGSGESFSVAKMKTLAEFNPGGRHPIFGSSLFDGSWWNNEHWGLGVGYLKISNIIIFALLAVIVYIAVQYKEINFKELAKSTTATLLYSSIFLYIAAQVTFPLIYMPSRYIAVPSLILSAVLLFLLVGKFAEFLSNFVKNQTLATALIVISGFGFWLYYHNYYHARFVSIKPNARAKFATLPKDALIASHPLLPEINTAAITSKRMVFADYERSMSYSPITLQEIRRRNVEALRMTYASSVPELKTIMKRNNVTHFFISDAVYSPGYLSKPYYMEPYNQILRRIIKEKLDKKQKFTLQEYMRKKNSRYALISVDKL